MKSWEIRTWPCTFFMPTKWRHLGCTADSPIYITFELVSFSALCMGLLLKTEQHHLLETVADKILTSRAWSPRSIFKGFICSLHSVFQSLNKYLEERGYADIFWWHQRSPCLLQSNHPRELPPFPSPSLDLLWCHLHISMNVLRRITYLIFF